LLSASTEAESIKTLVGLGRPIEAEPCLGFFEDALPDSSVREFDGEDGEDAFAEHEADTCVELLPPVGELLNDVEPSDGLASEDRREEPESSPLPANWEDDDEEATRPQLFLPEHASEPPPSLPGTRLADSHAESEAPRVSAPAAPMPSSPFVTESEPESHPGGLNPRTSGMLAGAGMGAASAIALVALCAWRSSPHVSEPSSFPASPPNELLPASGASAPSAVMAEPAAEKSSPLATSAASETSAPPSRERLPTRESSAVTPLPVTLDEEPLLLGPRGMLRVSSLPPAHVVLDGRPLGMTPRLLPVAAGEHTLLFVHPELGRRTLRVSVENDAKSEAFNRF